MKAIVRTDYHEKEFGVKSGDVVEVLDNLNSQVDGAGIYNNPGMGMCSLCKDANGGLHYIAIRNLEVIDFTPTIDWQHYRIQAAIAAMQAVLTNYEYYAEGIKTECENSNTTRPKVVAFMARELADALVEELQKKGGENEH